MKIPGSSGLLKALSAAVVDQLRQRRAALAGGRSGGARTARVPVSSSRGLPAARERLPELHGTRQDTPGNGGLSVPSGMVGDRKAGEPYDRDGLEMPVEAPVLVAAELRQIRVEVAGGAHEGDRYTMAHATSEGYQRWRPNQRFGLGLSRTRSWPASRCCSPTSKRTMPWATGRPRASAFRRR